jgi:hypothetical protein
MSRKRKYQQDAAVEQLFVEQAAPVVTVDSDALIGPSKWTVAQTTKVSLFGYFTVLARGTVISLADYGPQNVERLREQGVVLEPMV